MKSFNIIRSCVSEEFGWSHQMRTEQLIMCISAFTFNFRSSAWNIEFQSLNSHTKLIACHRRFSLGLRHDKFSSSHETEIDADVWQIWLHVKSHHYELFIENLTWVHTKYSPVFVAQFFIKYKPSASSFLCFLRSSSIILVAPSHREQWRGNRHRQWIFSHLFLMAKMWALSFAQWSNYKWEIYCGPFLSDSSQITRWDHTHTGDTSDHSKWKRKCSRMSRLEVYGLFFVDFVFVRMTQTSAMSMSEKSRKCRRRKN